MIFISVEIDDAITQAWFDYAGYKIRDAREPLRDTMWQVVFPAIRGQLESQGARGGEPYQALSLEYGIWKDLHFSGEPILRLTGDMERALFDPFSFRATKTHLHYEPRSDYAHWHQEGGYVEGRPPQRTIIDLIPEDYHQIENIFQLWLDELRFANPRRTGPGTNPGAPPINVLGL